MACDVCAQKRWVAENTNNQTKKPTVGLYAKFWLNKTFSPYACFFFWYVCILYYRHTIFVGIRWLDYFAANAVTKKGICNHAFSKRKKNLNVLNCYLLRHKVRDFDFAITEKVYDAIIKSHTFFLSQCSFLISFHSICRHNSAQHTHGTHLQ